MSNLSMFFAQNAVVETTEDFVVSSRFKDDKGKAVAWKLRTVTEEENSEIRKAATKRTKGKGGVYIPEMDYTAYMAKLISACVVFPDLKDAELQKSYGVVGTDALIRKMLLAGEYGGLAEKIQTLNGFDKDETAMVEEVKN